MMTTINEAELAAMEEMHFKTEFSPGEEKCQDCHYETWPCSAMRLIADYREKAAENERLRSENDALSDSSASFLSELERLRNTGTGPWCDVCGHEGPCHPGHLAEIARLRAAHNECDEVLAHATRWGDEWRKDYQEAFTSIERLQFENGTLRALLDPERGKSFEELYRKRF